MNSVSTGTGKIPAINRLTLIGAKGGMGRLFAGLIRTRELTVHEFDRPLQPKRLVPCLEASDLVLLAVPILAVHEVLEQIRPFLPASAIVADICSVKEHPVRMMLEAHAGPVVGTHPLFGPSPAPETELRVAVVPGRDKPAANAVHDFLHSLGLTPFATTAKAHDEAVAKIQGLNFVTTISYLAAVAQDQEVLRFLTPSFQRRLQAAQKMLTEDGQLFQTLFEANPHSQSAVRHYRRFLNLAAAGDLDLLQEMAAWWWSPSTSGEEP